MLPSALPPPFQTSKKNMELLTLSEKLMPKMEFEPWSPTLHVCALPLVPSRLGQVRITFCLFVFPQPPE